MSSMRIFNIREEIKKCVGYKTTFVNFIFFEILYLFNCFSPEMSKIRLYFNVISQSCGNNCSSHNAEPRTNTLSGNTGLRLLFVFSAAVCFVYILGSCTVKAAGFSKFSKQIFGIIHYQCYVVSFGYDLLCFLSCN